MLYTILHYAHIIAGVISLAVFWLPIAVKKGSRKHNRLGRVYVNAMYVASATGAAMSLSAISVWVMADNEQTGAFQPMWALLLYLSLLTFTTVRHAVLVLKAKQTRLTLKALPHLGLTVSLLGFGIVIGIYGYVLNHILLMIFGVLGAFLGGNFLHYSFKQTLTPREWIFEHLSSILGSGIACHTAFFAFGGRTLFASSSQLQLLSWILPGIVGTVLIVYFKRRYLVKFS
ncbi:hypothetical protein PALB_11230 [Pseudoalteromonas luteoviolacea B = ATCC 29581]|nr:hypothetical protein PALB_11230 [Pseudoalteromonas luteoviolacea B = ATCC 29581]